MRLFKNRGDIYIPKTGKGNTKEAKVLFVLLVFIVIFTVVFVALLGTKYKSAAEFFGEGEVTVTQNEVQNSVDLPSLTGKTNFLVMETDDTGKELHYLILIQADKASVSYKAAALSTELSLDGKKVKDIFDLGGGAELQARLTEYLGVEIDYYAVFDSASFVEFTGKLGNIIYPLNSDIRFSGGSGDDKYTIHFNEGEEKLTGRDISNLLRYFSSETKDYFSESELALKALTGLLNEENYAKAESLFRLFVKSTTTDITVRDFENGKESLYVYCVKNNDITIYTVKTEYDENGALTQNSAREVKGYFSK
ncbi:MAG: LCP family protein [Eubacterium sp.]|nr:LCP family protein [Eubacterium sp.]